MRADAVRNRGQIVDAARELVARDGDAVRMDALAARAGVAVGTLYRHFPTKADLVEAVVESSISQLADETEGALEAVRTGADLADTFRQVVHTVAARHSQDRALKDAARGIGVLVPAADGSGPQTPEMERALGAIVALVDQAIAAGIVRADTTGDYDIELHTEYPDSASYARREEIFQPVMAAQGRTLVDGLDRSALGEIIALRLYRVMPAEP